jgi:hypothetical protein
MLSTRVSNFSHRLCIEGLLWYIRKFFLRPWRRDWRILATAAVVAEPILDSLPLTLRSGIRIPRFIAASSIFSALPAPPPPAS